MNPSFTSILIELNWGENMKDIFFNNFFKILKYRKKNPQQKTD